MLAPLRALEKRRPIDHLAHGAIDPRRHLAADPAGLARGLDHRHSHPRGHRRTERGIGSCGDRQSDAGQSEDQLVGLLAGGKPCPFPHRIADIAEYEQISERRSGEPRQVLGLTGDEAAREALDRARGSGGGGIRGVDLGRQRSIDRHIPIAGEFEEALGQVGIVDGKRVLDLTRGDRGVERARDSMIGERHRIVLGGQQQSRLEGAGRKRERGDRQGNRHRQRHRDPPSGHGTRFLHPTNLVSRPCADKMPAGKISRFAATRPWAGRGNVRKPIVRPQISTVCSSQRRRGWLWSAALAAGLFRRGRGAAINAMRVLALPKRCRNSAQSGRTAWRTGSFLTSTTPPGSR